MDVQPKITPSIKGMVFLNPKLKPEWDAIILFGPGVKDVAIPNKTRVKNWGYIF